MASLITIPLRQTTLILILFASLFSSIQTDAEQLFFRVINESGNIELKAQLTPEEAKRGYSVVTLGGHVVSVVEPEPTEEEVAARSIERAIRDKAEKLEKAQKEYDYALLLRFSSMQDLEDERDRKLRDFDVRISILRSNLSAIKEKLDIQQKLAADTERLGRKVPAAILENIAALETEIQETNLTIGQLLSEKETIAEKYKNDGQRLQTLLKPRNKNNSG